MYIFDKILLDGVSMKKTMSVAFHTRLKDQKTTHSAELDLRTGDVLVVYDETFPNISGMELSVSVEDMEVGVIENQNGGFEIHPDDLDDIITTING